jgi:hypothetical protein
MIGLHFTNGIGAASFNRQLRLRHLAQKEWDDTTFEQSFIDRLNKQPVIMFGGKLYRMITWLHVEDITPKPGHRVLLWGKDGSQEVGSLDHKIGMWNVRGQPVPFDNFTHWQMLPSGPEK